MSTQSHFPMVCFRAASISQAKPAAISIGASEHRPGFEGVGDGIHIAGSWRKPRKPRLEPVATDLVSADRAELGFRKAMGRQPKVESIF